VGLFFHTIIEAIGWVGFRQCVSPKISLQSPDSLANWVDLADFFVSLVMSQVCYPLLLLYSF